MQYRLLGKSGLKVSAYCLGAMTFGRESDEAESQRIIHAALDHGVSFIDTAELYEDGVSETIVGKALKGGKRDSVILATKVNPKHSISMPEGDLTRRHIRRACDGSLKRLQTDYIDLYILHRPPANTPLEETLGALELLTRQGKILYAGVSMFSAWQLADALRIAERNHWRPIVNVQSRYSLIERGLDDEVIPFCETRGVGLTAYSPMAGGVLTGKYASPQAIPADTRAADYKRFAGMLTDRATAIVAECRQIAAARNLGPHHVALAWTLACPALSAAIIGARTASQLEDTARGFDLTLTREELKRLNQVSERPDWAK